MSSAVQKLSKPVMRGLYESSIKKHLGIAIVLSISAGLAWKYGVAEPRKVRYAEFYKTYDVDKEYERLKKLDLYPKFPKG